MSDYWSCGRFEFSLKRPLLMGIVNVTPDSFSDGGQHLSAEAAIAHARTLIVEGAQIIDLGAESTRPGALPVSVQEELARLLPVIAALHRALPGSKSTLLHGQSLQHIIKREANTKGIHFDTLVCPSRKVADRPVLLECFKPFGPPKPFWDFGVGFSILSKNECFRFCPDQSSIGAFA